MIVIKADVKVEKVEYGQGRAEMVNVNVMPVKHTIKVMSVHVPLRTNKWPIFKHEEMLRDTLNSF